jgi:hypothetical protein
MLARSHAAERSTAEATVLATSVLDTVPLNPFVRVGV